MICIRIIFYRGEKDWLAKTLGNSIKKYVCLHGYIKNIVTFLRRNRNVYVLVIQG